MSSVGISKLDNKQRSLDMISEQALRSYRLVEWIKGIFRKKKPLTEIYSEELTSILTQISENQSRLKVVLEKMSGDAQEIKDQLYMEELVQLQERRMEHETWLQRAGINPSCVGEFLEDPSLENLEKLRKKYPLRK
jgi:hypothetical protein